MKNNASFVFALLLVLGDFLALLAAFSVAYILRVKLDPRPLIEQIPALTYFWASAAVLPLWILVHSFIGLYNQSVYNKRFSELGRLLIGSFIGILVVIGYDFVMQVAIFPARLVPIYGFALGFSFLVAFRSIARITRRTLFKYNIGISNVLVIGDTTATEHIIQAIADTHASGQRILGTVGRKISSIKHFADLETATTHIRRPIHSIIQTELYRDQSKNNAILQYAHEHHVAYRFLPGNSDMFVGNIELELFQGSIPMIAVNQTPLVGWGRIVKRLFDLGMSLVLLFVSAPLFLLIALFQKITEPKSPIFFRQTRLTRFNREFTVFKFRTLKRKYNVIIQ